MELNALDLGAGPAALLLHGQPGRASHWLAVAAVLGRRMRVLVPDRPGYGRSEAEAGGFRLNAEAAVELLDKRGVKSAVVAAHSWAGGAAIAMAARFPERVAGLVLVGSMVPRPHPRLVDRAFAHPRLGPPATRLAFAAGASALSVPLSRRLARAAAPGFPTGELSTIAAEWRGSRVWRSFYAEQRALVEELPSLAGELATLQVPTIVLTGRRDLFCPPSEARALADALPNARLLIVGGGHLLPQERPRLVSELIARPDA